MRCLLLCCALLAAGALGPATVAAASPVPMEGKLLVPGTERMRQYPERRMR